MITHYLPIWTKMNGSKGLAVCQRYVDYASDSDQPTCEDCRRLIAEEDSARNVGIDFNVNDARNANLIRLR